MARYKQPARFSQPIPVTKPFLPPIEEFQRGLEEIWQNQWLTNNGPVLTRFEREIQSYTGSQNVSMFNNGTLALQIALQGLGITGEVITTPFTFVATTHALTWNKIRPIFVDIEPDFYTLDPARVEEAITPWTTAILAVHVYGYPCNHNALSNIARRHNIKLIYDAAHAFGVKVGGESIAEFGDMSMFSFHATKAFHSAEGGMLTYSNSALRSSIEYLRNFGFKSETEVVMTGTNAKMNELQALMGISVLKYFPVIVEKKHAISNIYLERLKDIPGIKLPTTLGQDVDYNYSYFPIEIDEVEFGKTRDAIYESLKDYNVFCRRYFYPLVNELSCYQQVQVIDPLVTAHNVSTRILNLPTYYDLDLSDVERICDLVVYLQDQ